MRVKSKPAKCAVFMQDQARGENLRQSYRCAVDESHRGAELCAAGKWTPVELIDESAGGFGILCDGPPGVAVGDVVQLHVAGECYDARVIYVEEQSPGDEGVEPALRVGLKRVGEYFGEAVAPLPWYKFFFRRYRQRPFSSRGTLLAAAFIFAMVIGAAPFIITNFLDSRGIGDLRTKSRGDRNTDGAIRSRDAVMKPSRPGSASPFASDFDDSEGNAVVRQIPKLIFPNSQNSSLQNSLNHKRDAGFMQLMEYAKLKENIGRWRDQVLDAIAYLIEKLGLTEPQKKEVDALLQQTDEAIAKFDAPNPEYTPQTVLREKTTILEGAYGKLMQIFTEAQRLKWNEMLKQLHSETTPPTQEPEKTD